MQTSSKMLTPSTPLPNLPFSLSHHKNLNLSGTQNPGGLYNHIWHIHIGDMDSASGPHNCLWASSQGHTCNVEAPLFSCVGATSLISNDAISFSGALIALISGKVGNKKKVSTSLSYVLDL